MNGDDKQFLDKRLTKLETKMEEKWSAHDTHSNERWGEIKDAIKTIEGKMNCGVHSERMKALSGRINVAWGFIVMIIGSIVGGFFWLVRK